MSPSSMNGTRMNQFVAPTSFITSISRRRANMAVRIVFQINITATRAARRPRRGSARARKPVTLLDPAPRYFAGEDDLLHAGLVLELLGRSPPMTLASAVRGTTR